MGFDACGVSQACALANSEPKLKEWLKDGMHGEMGYMERNVDKRIDPTLLVPGGKSVVSVLLNYFPGNPEISVNSPRISRYALGTDYHTVMKEMLWAMLELMRKDFGAINGRAFVDSAPVLERAWAVKAGLGWIGKNSMLIHPKLGTFTFIGELIVSLEIEPSTTQMPNRCGTCTRCIDACPTGAIVTPGVVNARKCISYLTIEKKSPLTDYEKQSLNGWCLGCDICQEVCPWNGKIKLASLNKIEPKKEITNLKGSQLQNLTEQDFNSIFGKTPIDRAGYERFVGNCRTKRIE